MARRCEISGKAGQNGNRVSHANNKRHHVFQANVQSKRIWIPELGRRVTLNLSTNMIRTIDKIGVTAALKKNGLTLADLLR